VKATEKIGSIEPVNMFVKEVAFLRADTYLANQSNSNRFYKVLIDWKKRGLPK